MLFVIYKSRIISSLSLILDPRHKVEEFDVTASGKNFKDCSILKFEDVYKNNYYLENSNEAAHNIQNTLKYNPEEEDLIDIGTVYLHRETSSSWKTEINNYLHFPRECAENGSRHFKFNCSICASRTTLFNKSFNHKNRNRL